MESCSRCGAARQPGERTCAACGWSPSLAAPGGTSWVRVFTGRALLVDLLEAELSARGITVLRESPEAMGALPTTAFPGIQFFSLSVPEDQHQARSAELRAVVEEITGEAGAAEYADAAAEAEEDYDVRGCPGCRRYFHNSFAACPACGVPLQPAVEVFEQGRLEPDRVIVAQGAWDGMSALAARLRGEALDARILPAERDSNGTVDLPWRELTDRTHTVEEILAQAERP